MDLSQYKHQPTLVHKWFIPIHHEPVVDSYGGMSQSRGIERL
jgi:hypothetical protein